MAHVIEFSEKCREVCDRLDQRKSVLVVAPHHFGKSILFEYIHSYTQKDKVLCIRVTSRVPTLEGQVDYGLLWEAVRGHFHKPSKLLVADRESFMKAFETAVSREEVRVLVFIRGSGRGNEENHYEILATFHRLMVTRPALGGGKLTVLASDDYSLFYWNKKPFPMSPLHSYQPEIHLAPLEVNEIKACLTVITQDFEDHPADAEIALIAQRIHSVSGGHPGLAQELITGLPARSWARTEDEWDYYTRVHHKNSTILENLNQALAEDPEGYSRTALEYLLPSFPESNSPRIHMLRQLGILQRETPATVRICPGVIKAMVQEIYQRPNAPYNVGTVLSEAGPRLFIPGQIDSHDDDLVVLHLSDLHVSSQHYKHRFPKGQLNKNEHSAGELLRDDLKTLNLVGKIDGVVFTGDFVWSGDMEEFLRAQEVIEEILDAVGVGLDRTLLIPGNHDIRWAPGDLSSTPFDNRASRDLYDAFLKILGKTSDGTVDVLELMSRSGMVKLRILGLDSNRVEGPEAPGIGYVSRQSLLAAKQYLDTMQAASGSKNVLTWMAVHHHIFPACSLPLGDAQKKKVSVMGNAAELLDYANQWGIEMVLHGHEHQPSVTVARRWPVDDGDVFAPVTSLGAGSFGVIRDHLGPFSRNHYYVIHRRPDEIIIRSRCQGAGGVKFIPHADLHIPRPTSISGSGMSVSVQDNATGGLGIRSTLAGKQKQI